MATEDSKPCWINEKLPPPVPSSYSPKGDWEVIGELKAYLNGPRSSEKALIVIYDAFGVSSQIVQGVDRLSEHLNALVIMPDFFKGNGLDHDEFVRNPQGMRPLFQEFAKTHGNIESQTKILLDFVTELHTKFQSVKSVGVFGLCWGGKLAVVASVAENNPFKASGQTHPGRLAAEDVRALTIPHICMPSKDEPADIVAEYEKILAEKGLGKVERFDNMFHGWMGARADLTNKENLIEYQRGYAMAAEFFAKHL